MNVILDLPYAVCIWISAAVAITYTLLGGLYSVAYTDIIQLALIFVTSVRELLCIHSSPTLTGVSEHAHKRLRFMLLSCTCKTRGAPISPCCVLYLS